MGRVRRLGLAVLTSLLLVAVGTGAAFGVLALTTITDGMTTAEAASAPVSPNAPAAPGQEVAETPTVRPKPEPEPVLEPGDRGVDVRELQGRLSQLSWYTPPMSGEYDRATLLSVRGFQQKRGFEATGVVDRRTWNRLAAMSRMPTKAEMFNLAGPVLLELGDAGAEVREIQARLRQIGWFFGEVTDHYGGDTETAVRGFQAKRMIPATGKVDQRTLDLLEGMTSEPTADELANRAPDPAEGSPLDARCTTGRVLCIDKSTNSLRWVVDGKVMMTFEVRFGSDEMPTREGQFAVTYKSRDHVSSLYDTSMPFAMFFSGGQAVHYSPDFAANGYDGASHGCVNVRDYDAIASLFDQVYVGDKVVVYWS